MDHANVDAIGDDEEEEPEFMPGEEQEVREEQEADREIEEEGEEWSIIDVPRKRYSYP